MFTVIKYPFLKGNLENEKKLIIIIIITQVPDGRKQLEKILEKATFVCDFFQPYVYKLWSFYMYETSILILYHGHFPFSLLFSKITILFVWHVRMCLLTCVAWPTTNTNQNSSSLEEKKNCLNYLNHNWTWNMKEHAMSSFFSYSSLLDRSLRGKTVK